MIKLTKMDGKEFVLNAEHIQEIEKVPETLITLINGKKYIVLEKETIVVDKVIDYKRKIYGR